MMLLPYNLRYSIHVLFLLYCQKSNKTLKKGTHYATSNHQRN